MATKRRIVAALIASLLLTSILPASASGFEEESGRLIGPVVPNFEGTTSFTSMGGFNSIEVRLTKPSSVSLDPFFNSDIQVKSRAALAGISIRQADGDIEVISMSVATCLEAPCKKALSFTTSSSMKARQHLPAGNYIVTLFSDSSSVRATVKLEGLTGKTAWGTYTPAEGSAGDLEPYINDNTIRPMYSAETRQSLTGMGMVLIGMVVETPKGPQEGEIDTCLSSESTPVDIPAPHQILCRGSGSFTSWGNDNGTYALMLDYYLTDAGDYTHSINFRGVTESKGARAFQLSLDYESGKRKRFSGGTVFGTGN